MWRTGFCALVLLVASSARAEERPLDMSLESLALFKNGLACVEYVAEIPEGGVYRVEHLPDAVHGTFWVESDADVTVRMSRRSVDLPISEATSAEFQQDLTGREVVVRFKEPHLEPVAGKVITSGKEKAWSRDYEPSRYGWWSSSRTNQTGAVVGMPMNEPMLALETPNGLTYLKTSMIAAFDLSGRNQTVACERPVMLLEISVKQKKPTTVVIRALTKGLAWAPSYQIDISDPTTLSLRQNAVLRNELVPIQNADIRLISGFPSVKFANVTSPMSPETTWAQFFQQLNEQYSGRGGNSFVMSQSIASNGYSPQQGIDLSAIPVGEGADLHFQSIGRRALDLGDSLTLQTAAAKAGYERIVEWIIPDRRDVNGNLVDNRNSDLDEEIPWDALRFRNPLEFAMTTAPAMIVANGRFLGQQTSFWVNVGEQTTLHITKALSVRTLSNEREAEGQRVEVPAFGRTYRKTKVEGEVIANNHRNEQITMVVRKRFSGELLSADGEPKTTLLEEGVWSINQRNELVWTVQLAPGAEQRFAYSYSVLTRN